MSKMNSRDDLKIRPSDHPNSEAARIDASDPRFANMLPAAAPSANAIQAVLGEGSRSVQMYAAEGTSQYQIEQKYLHAQQKLIDQHLDPITGDVRPGSEDAVRRLRLAMRGANESAAGQAELDAALARERAVREQDAAAKKEHQTALSTMANKLHFLNQERKQAGLPPVTSIREHMDELNALSELLAAGR